MRRLITSFSSPAAPIMSMRWKKPDKIVRLAVGCKTGANDNKRTLCGLRHKAIFPGIATGVDLKTMAMNAWDGTDVNERSYATGFEQSACCGLVDRFAKG